MSEARGAPTLEIISPGMLTTVQDKGRWGYQRYGMPTAGAMDAFALRCANLLAGNDDGAAGLETTAIGPRIRLLADACVAITGADAQPTLDGEPMPMWEAVCAGAGAVIALGAPRDGVRAYLAVSGGVDVPMVMGSRSTYIKAGIGGLEGRPLRAGDVLRAGAARHSRGRMPPGGAPRYGRGDPIGVVLGPQDSAFTAAGIDAFLTSEYAVSMDADRMGCRLEGPPIERASGADVISDGNPMGAVQVPGDGKPIILMADRGTTGGYTKIGVVASADIGKMAQAMPGAALRFRAMSVERAQNALRAQEAVLAAIRESASAAPPPRIAAIADGEVAAITDILG